MMLLKPKVVAFILAVVIALVTTASLAVLNNVPVAAFIVAALISFSLSYLLIYFTLQFFIFKEIKKTYDLLNRIKNKDFEFVKTDADTNENPIKKLKQEIYTYAYLKHLEIAELKKIETYRREFLADVSHELKTPLFAAQGFVHTLLDGAINDKSVRIKFLKKAAKSLSGLNKLVQDLLAISQMEAGNMKMHFSYFDIHVLIQDVFEQMEDKAEKKELNLCFSESSPSQAWVYADREKIFQVMNNLILNGIKYTYRTGGKIMVNLISDPENIIIEVIDDGIGIPREDLSRIFERFYRVDKSRSKEKGGTGLGLAIVKHILDAHGQKINVSSVLGAGSTFRFALPKSVTEPLDITPAG